MADHAKLNSIIAKARLIRQSSTITPTEMVLSDLVEALALELQDHDNHGGHIRTIGSALGALPAGSFGTPYHDTHFKEQP